MALLKDHYDASAMRLAKQVAQTSPNHGRKTSVVFVRDGRVVMWACNNFPPGVRQFPERFERPACYNYIEHAERNAVAEAAKRGIPLEGCTAYLPWFPCVECARMLVGVGTVRMVCVEPDWGDTHYNFKDSRTILEECGVQIDYTEAF